MVATAVAAPLCGYASTPTPQHTADVPQEAAKELAVTRNAWVECLRAAIPRLDQPPSSSEGVARAAVAKAEREATRAATEEVVTERVQVAGAQVLKCE
jgi:hypothetical protein